MKIEDTIRAWKDPEFRKKLSADNDHPAGPHEVTDNMLRELGGGSTLYCQGSTLDCTGWPGQATPCGICRRQ